MGSDGRWPSPIQSQQESIRIASIPPRFGRISAVGGHIQSQGSSGNYSFKPCDRARAIRPKGKDIFCTSLFQAGYSSLGSFASLDVTPKMTHRKRNLRSYRVFISL